MLFGKNGHDKVRRFYFVFLIDDFTDDDDEKNRIVNKKAKGTKKCVTKREILFNNYLDSLFKNKVLYRS